MRPRLAPSALRTTSSASREAARANSSSATLEQMRTRSVTAKKLIENIAGSSLPGKSAAYGVTCS